MNDCEVGNLSKLGAKLIRQDLVSLVENDAANLPPVYLRKPRLMISRTYRGQGKGAYILNLSVTTLSNALNTILVPFGTVSIAAT